MSRISPMSRISRISRISRGRPVTLGRVVPVLLAAIPLLVLLLFFGYPVAGTLARGLAPQGHPDLGAVLEVLTRPRTARVLWFTLWSSATATAISVVAGLPMAYALYRLRFPGRGLLRALVVIPFVLPTVVVGVAFGQLVGPGGLLHGLGWEGSSAAIVAALVFFNICVVVRTVGSIWEGLDPRREEAAAALGASPRQVFATVTLRALLPGIVGAATVVFLFCSTAFGVVITLGGLRHANVETEIWLLTTQQLDLRAAAALSVLQILVIAGLLLLTRLVQRGQGSHGAGSGRRPVPLRAPSGRTSWAVGWTGVVTCLLMLPVITLVQRSLEHDGSWSLASYRDLVRPTGAGQVSVLTGLSNSLQIAAVATALALGLGLLVAGLTGRGPSTATRSLFDAIFMLPLGVSAVTLGFGFLITLDEPPLDLRSSPWLVPIAQAMVALPLVVRTVAPALRAIDDRQRQAAASLGAGPLRVLCSVDLPAVWRPVLAATGFAFAISLGEFGATSFVVRDETPTLPIMIGQLISRPGSDSFEMAMAASVILAGITAVVMLAIERLTPTGVGSVGAF